MADKDGWMWDLDYVLKRTPAQAKKLDVKIVETDDKTMVKMSGSIPDVPGTDELMERVRAEAVKVASVDGMDAEDPASHAAAFRAVRDYCDAVLEMFGG